MTLTTIRIILTGITLISIIAGGISLIHLKKAADNNSNDRTSKITKNGRIMEISGIILILTAICSVSLFFIKGIGEKHGMISDNITIQKLIYSIRHSPKEDSLPEDTTGCVILYYKFGCKDCEEIYEETKATLKEKDAKVYWISTETKQGKNLLEKYPVEEVPTGIYIRKNSYNNALSYTQKPLATDTGEKEKELDTEALNRLLLLQKEER